MRAFYLKYSFSWKQRTFHSLSQIYFIVMYWNLPYSFTEVLIRFWSTFQTPKSISWHHVFTSSPTVCIPPNLTLIHQKPPSFSTMSWHEAHNFLIGMLSNKITSLCKSLYNNIRSATIPIFNHAVSVNSIIHSYIASIMKHNREKSKHVIHGVIW